jgi:hypothetical protein
MIGPETAILENVGTPTASAEFDCLNFSGKMNFDSTEEYRTPRESIKHNQISAPSAGNWSGHYEPE